ncbi:MAG: hypothetical protein V1870_01325 [Candidatus Aenigmatarchaeota archaeon]
MRNRFLYGSGWRVFTLSTGVFALLMLTVYTIYGLGILAIFSTTPLLIIPILLSYGLITLIFWCVDRHLLIKNVITKNRFEFVVLVGLLLPIILFTFFRNSLDFISLIIYFPLILLAIVFSNTVYTPWIIVLTFLNTVFWIYVYNKFIKPEFSRVELALLFIISIIVAMLVIMLKFLRLFSGLNPIPYHFVAYFSAIITFSIMFIGYLIYHWYRIKKIVSNVRKH